MAFLHHRFFSSLPNSPCSWLCISHTELCWSGQDFVLPATTGTVCHLCQNILSDFNETAGSIQLFTFPPASASFPSTIVSKAIALLYLKVEETGFFLGGASTFIFKAHIFTLLQKEMTGQHSCQSIFLTHASFYNFYRANCLCVTRLSRCQYWSFYLSAHKP